MHVGNVRTALYAWLFARKNKGQFILRIEDTDQKREVVGSLEHIKKSLKWLGLNWDQGPEVGGPYVPYIQSERMKQLGIYKKYAEKLIEKGFVYADTKSEEELDKLRGQAELDKKAFLYREYRPENPVQWKEGIPLRFKIKEPKRTTWQDAVRGELTAGPEALDDFILIKSDGYPTYNFAHIVDDIEMGVTHVVRGQEFISSTPNYIAVYEALEAKEPIYITVPPIMGAEGKKKLGKRDGAKDILDYEKEGYLPETMVNYLTFLGFNPGGEKEIYTREELINVFDLDKIQRSGAQWNEEKLDWMNKEHIKLLPKEEIEKEILKNLPEEMRKKDLVPVVLERISKWGDIKKWVEERKNITIETKNHTTTETINNYDKTSTKESVNVEFKQETINTLKSNDYLDPVKDPIWNDINVLFLIPKDLEKNIVVEYLEETKKIIEGNDWEKIIEKNDENKLWIFSGEKGRGKVLSPFRVALSGSNQSIDLFEIMKNIGKEPTLRRIGKAIEALGDKAKNNTSTQSSKFTIKK
jgi:glutamyl-tRNA synthetase